MIGAEVAGVKEEVTAVEETAPIHRRSVALPYGGCPGILCRLDRVER
jgi:hypothetical protein